MFQWEAFSVPELENFLRILDREEAEYVDQLKAKYQLLKIQTHKQLKRVEQERQNQNDTQSQSQSSSQTGTAPKEESTSCDKSDTSKAETLHFSEDTREPVFV